MDEENYELSEHDKQMIAVAEGGDPNDPAENTDVRLPSEGEPSIDELKPEDMSKEQLLELLNSQKESEGEAEDEDAEDDGEDLEDDSDEGVDDDELSEADQRLLEAENKLRELSAYEVAGGKEAYQELVGWGSENLSEDQVDVFNKAVTAGDPNMVKFAVEAVQALQKLSGIENFGHEGELNLGDGTTTQRGVTGYQSQAEMQRDMSDPRYSTDPAFQERVMQRLAITQSF